MQRIFLPHTPFNQTLNLSDTTLHHQLTRVMRARIWDTVIFFDGENHVDYVYKIKWISKSDITLELEDSIEKKSEICIWLSLYQSVPNKYEKIEYIIQKCCEVGYKDIYFFSSEFSQKLSITENKLQRFQKIAIEAIEQCWGNIIPSIAFHDSLDFEKLRWRKIFCHTESSQSNTLKEIVFNDIDNICLCVGPEWGFSSHEVDVFDRLWFEHIYLWNRIFRTETVWPSVWFYISQTKKSF